MGMQILVIVFIFLLLVEHRKEQKFPILVFMALILFNGFTLIHTLFVWPKMYSALYQAIAFYALYQIYTNRYSNYIYYFAIAFILSFLAHGGSAFYLISISIILLIIYSPWRNLKQYFHSSIIVILIYLPWMLYQKLYDPPGDRLLKWHLANYVPITQESFLNILYKVYQEMSFARWIEMKLNNFKIIFDSIFFHLNELEIFRPSSFFSLGYSFWFFPIFLYLFLLLQNKYKFKPFVLLLSGSFILYVIVWGIILLSESVIHQGAYFGWFAGFIGLLFITFSLSKWLFYLLTIGNMTIFGYYYYGNLFSIASLITLLLLIVLTKKVRSFISVELQTHQRQ